MANLDIFLAFNVYQCKEFFKSFELLIPPQKPPIAFWLALEGVYYTQQGVNAILAEHTETTIDDIIKNHFPDLQQQPRTEVDELADQVSRVLELTPLRRDYDRFTRVKNKDDMLKSIAEMDERNPLIAVLALQAFLSITKDQQRLNECESANRFREFLREWRDSFECVYKKHTQLVLRALGRVIFKCMEVPLFIDDYGNKVLQRKYQENELEDIEINSSTHIYHDTHKKEAEQIKKEKAFKPSDNKNGIPGLWFGFGSDQTSNYGSCRFKTTLAQLGVTGLRQGEIVSYTNEHNVILYAHKEADGNFLGLKKPTEAAVTRTNENASVHVSIFVQENVFSGDNQNSAVSDYVAVEHKRMCIRELRTGIKCPDGAIGKWKRGQCYKKYATGKCNKKSCKYEHNF